MSYYLSVNMTLLPEDAMRQVEMVALAAGIRFEAHCYLTSTQRKPRFPGDKSYHRMNMARDFDFLNPGSLTHGRVERPKMERIFGYMRAALPAEWFDVVLEEDHIHVEYDPK